MEDVKIIWSEMVMPCDPTPSHLKTRKLSRLDQNFPLCHNPIILFYSAPKSLPSSSSSSSESDHDHLVLTMKASLSKALSPFYPLAGRLFDDFTIVCEDEGVLLNYAQVTCPLKSYLSLISRSMFNLDGTKQPLVKLLPSEDSLHGCHQNKPIPISTWVQLAVQVNIFKCGGIAIGCYKNHKLLDVISLITFLQHWAGLCLGQGPEQLIQPNFDAAPTAFPPNDPVHLSTEVLRLRDRAMDKLLKPSPDTSTTSCKAFVFKPSAISALREMSASNRVPHPSRVESVVGFLWKYCVAAEGALGPVGPTALTLTLSMRPRAHPPFPRGSMGNIGTNVVAQAKEITNNFKLVDLVAEIREAINGFNYDKKVKEIHGDKGKDALPEHNQMVPKEGLKPSIYRVSSQCRLGITDVDFGFGKPIWITPLTELLLVQKRFIFLMDHIDPTHATVQDQVNGIEAWLLMEKRQMQILETDPDFLAFASPLDLSSIN